MVRRSALASNRFLKMSHSASASAGHLRVRWSHAMPANGFRPERVSHFGEGRSAQLQKIAPIHFFVYFFTGIATNFLGPILPLLVRAWSISDAQAGSLFAAQFAGSALGSLVSTRRPSWSYAIGCACCAFAVPFMGWASWPLARSVILLNGIGVGLIINSGNIQVAGQTQTAGGSGSASLAKVHFAWGLGALGCPWIIRAVFQWVPSQAFFLLLGGSFATLTVGLLHKRTGAPAAAPQCAMLSKTTLPPRVQFFFAIALLLYTGTENAISGWLPSFAMRIYTERGRGGLDGSMQFSFLGMLCFTLLWAMELIGRGCVPAVLRYVSEPKLFNGTIASLFVSVTALATIPGRFQDHGAVLCAASAACGMSLAAIYPLLMGNLLKRAGSPQGIGWVFTCAPAGAAILPWISGGAATVSGSVRASLLVPCAAALLLLVLAPHLYSRPPETAIS